MESRERKFQDGSKIIQVKRCYGVELRSTKNDRQMEFTLSLIVRHMYRRFRWRMNGHRFVTETYPSKIFDFPVPWEPNFPLCTQVHYFWKGRESVDLLARAVKDSLLSLEPQLTEIVPKLTDEVGKIRE